MTHSKRENAMKKRPPNEGLTKRKNSFTIIILSITWYDYRRKKKDETSFGKSLAQAVYDQIYANIVNEQID